MTQVSTYISYAPADPSTFKAIFPDTPGPGDHPSNGRRHRLTLSIEAVAGCEAAFKMSEGEPLLAPAGGFAVQTVTVANWLEVTAGRPATMRVRPSPASPAGPTTVSVLSATHGMVARFTVDADGAAPAFTATWPDSPAGDRLIVADDRDL